MSTTYYLIAYPYRHAKDVENKKAIGIQTFENKKRCFTWIMQPGDFIDECVWYSRFRGVIDEYGHDTDLMEFVKRLQQIDIMRYNRDEAESLE